MEVDSLVAGAAPNVESSFETSTSTESMPATEATP
jgi:hypothetical protein